MAKIQDRIGQIGEYFRGMEIKNDFYIVKVQYGNRWGAYSREDEKIKVAHSEEVADEWFYYADINDVEFDEIFDLIDETIAMNKSALAKVELLKEKIEELKTLFEDNSLELLQTLEFTFSAPKKTKTRKYTKKKKDEPTDAVNVQIEPNENKVEEKTISK